LLESVLITPNLVDTEEKKGKEEIKTGGGLHAVFEWLAGLPICSSVLIRFIGLSCLSVYL